MKTKISQFLAGALALIAVSSASAASNIVVSVASESPVRTAFMSNDGYRVLAVYNIANLGTTAGRVSSLGFQTKGLQSIVLEVFGSTYQWQIDGKNPSYVWTQIPDIELGSGGSAKVTIRGFFVAGATEVSVAADSFGGNFDNGQVAELKPATHALVEKLSSEGVSNQSMRVTVSPTATATLGFVIDGDPERGQQVLIRAVGPGLKRLGVQGVLNDPMIKLFGSTGQMITENDDWSGLEDMFAQIGAFGLEKNSLDSAFAVYLTPGAYTVQLKPFGSGQGEVLFELYKVPERLNKKG